jgi:glycosyltransferase involved in cell wall biosynthesis/GNAT superfamily N-acetyltransferase
MPQAVSSQGLLQIDGPAWNFLTLGENTIGGLFLFLQPAPPSAAMSAAQPLRPQVVRILFRWLLAWHAALLWITGKLPWRKKRLPPGRPRSVLLTGTFFSENWIMNHLKPLALSDACGEATVVSLFPIPPTPKVRWIAPPCWLCRLLGETPARLLIFCLVALKNRPDFIGGFHLIPNGLLVTLLAPIVGARSLYFCGGGPREVLGGGIMGNRALESVKETDLVAETRLLKAMNRIDHIICMGNRTVTFYQNRGVASAFHVIPGGIDRTRFNTGKDVPKDFDLIFVGRLAPVKRLDLFIDAVALLVKSKPDLRAVIVGTGELEADLKAQAHSLGLEANLLFAGQQADVVSWLQRSRIFVLTSDSEGLSLAMMEALTCGLPCVVADVGELGEVIVNGFNGFLVPERTGAGFASALMPLLTSQDLPASIAAKASDTASGFEMYSTVSKWDWILGNADDRNNAEFVSPLKTMSAGSKPFRSSVIRTLCRPLLAWHGRIRKLRRDVQQRGVRVAIRRFLKDIYSATDFIVYLRHPDAMPFIPSEFPEGVNALHLDSQCAEKWIVRLASVWPPELEQYQAEHLPIVLEDRLNSGQECVIAHHGDEVLGAVWLSKVGIEFAALGNPFSCEARFVKSLFVAPRARGLRISKLLFAELFMMAQELGGITLISLIKDDRLPSLRAHEAAGFVKLGRLRTRSLFFHHYVSLS